MKPAAAPDPAAAPLRQRLHSLAFGLGLGSLMVAAAAALAWAVAELMGGDAAAAPVGAAVAVALISLPLAALMMKLSQDLDASRRQLARLDLAEVGVPGGGRGHFLALAEREWARARRYGGEPALLLVEVDRYARLVEARGTDAGDLVLRELERDIGPTLRGADALARFAPSQLAVWLAQADPIGALDVADRIRERCEALELRWQQQPLKVTASVGVAALRPAHQNLGSLIADAEQAVQAARQSGGNCVRAAPVDPSRSRRIGPSVGDNQAAGPSF